MPRFIKARTRQTPKTQGQLDYEADVARQPTYHDGAPRPGWEKLSDLKKWSWNKPYLPRDLLDMKAG